MVILGTRWHCRDEECGYVAKVSPATALRIAGARSLFDEEEERT